VPLSAEHRRVLAWVGAAYAVALAVAVAVGLLLRGRHPILVAAVADVAATLAVFAFSVAKDNSSLYDPYWSVAPLPVALYWSLADGRVGARQALVLLAVLAWGARLTWNCLRRWRSLDHEDFRYREIRARTGRLYWPASLFAIHLFPTAWVFLGLLPLYPALAAPVRPPGWLDLVAAAVALGGTAVEAAADRQLRRFLLARAHPAEVLDRGLWALSRHPNYLGEILFWWGLLLFGLAADPAKAWTAAGAISITALFVLVSVPWMDRRMLARHPAWAERMRRVPALLPWPRRDR
jgi:steroid 5-alpha reductase family enzyme